MAPRRLALLAAAATGVQVGASLVATRFVAAAVGPATLALFRYAIGFACLAPCAWLWAPTRFARRDILPIALLGIGQFGILIALLNFGVRTVPSGRAALIFAVMPLLSMLLAAALGQETLSWRRASGVVLSIAGVALALRDRAAGSGDWPGQVAVAASALTGAVCSVFYRPYLRRYPAVAVSAVAMLASVIFLAALAGGTEQLLAALPRPGWGGWLAVAGIGVGSGAGYFLWLFALRHAPATEVTVFLALSPLTALGLGWAWLGEPIMPSALAGVAAVASGLWLATR
jgi:drug/metabolite transporter (DMT)-like permease